MIEGFAVEESCCNALHLPAESHVQADVRRGAVYTVILGNGDFQQRILGNPQRPPEAENYRWVREHMQRGIPVGRGVNIHLNG